MMYSRLRHLPSVLVKGRPIQLTYFVTRQCNARCPWCFYLGNDGDREAAADELTLDEVRRIAGSLGRMLWIAFSGGEIYLRSDLVDIAKVFYEHNKPSIMLFPTNGLMPRLIAERTQRIVEACPRTAIVVKVSIDGLEETHDALRRTPGGFAKAMETHRLLARLRDRYRNLELGVNTVFCSSNQDQMDAIIDFVGGLGGANTHTITLIRGQSGEEDRQGIDFEKYRRAIDRLEADLKSGASDIYRFRGARLKTAQDILQRRLIHRTQGEGRRLIPCYAGRLNLVLSESGDVYPCEPLAQRLGNVRDFGYDLRAVAASRAARKVLADIDAGTCHCTHECYFITNILFNPRLWPSLIREYRLLGAARPTSRTG